MSKEFINKILDKMSNDIGIDKKIDVITETFISREDELQDIYKKNKTYKEITEKLKKLNLEITNTYKDSFDIISKFEEYSDLVDKKSYACEKLMYRLGVSDALILILEVVNKIDIDKFIEQNI